MFDITKPKFTAEMLDFTPEMATSWLAKYSYGRQRKIQNRHIGFLNDVRESANFNPLSPIEIACTGDEPLAITNGNHRLSMIARLPEGSVQPLFVMRVQVTNLGDVAQLYATHDIGMKSEHSATSRSPSARTSFWG